MSGADAVRTGLRGLGQILITFGAVVLLFCVYELEVTGLYTAQQQDRLGRQLTQQWAQEPNTPAQPGQPARPVPVALSLGGALARLHVPRFGADYAKVVVEGVATEDLKQGPGHYPGTALPGALGNVVLSGHRTTYGQPFTGSTSWTLATPSSLRPGTPGSPTGSPARRSSAPPRSR